MPGLATDSGIKGEEFASLQIDRNLADLAGVALQILWFPKW
jgi:hypothetical protein